MSDKPGGVIFIQIGRKLCRQTVIHNVNVRLFHQTNEFSTYLNLSYTLLSSSMVTFTSVSFFSIKDESGLHRTMVSPS
jgi:hypothetical protein